jgi:hypothetical protein
MVDYYFSGQGSVTGAGPLMAAAARRELGRQLAGLRHQAGFSQRHLARLTGYSATVVASAETGRPHVSSAFWARADDVLGADGQLAGGYERIRRMDRWARDHAHDIGTAVQDDRPAPPPGVASPGGGRTLTTPATAICPHCHQPLELVAQLAAPGTVPPSR